MSVIASEAKQSMPIPSFLPHPTSPYKGEGLSEQKDEIASSLSFLQ